jgi:hydrogenase nickel incorporation protein HypB
LNWLRRELAAQRERLEQGKTALPSVQPDGARLHGLAAPGHHHHHDHDHGHAEEQQGTGTR